MSPLEIYLDKMKTTVSIDLFLETLWNQTFENPLVNAVPYFTPAQNLGREFLLKTTTNIPFSEATAIAQKQFQGKEFPLMKEIKIKVEDIKVYAENENVVIEIQTSGKVNGISYIKGKLIYDAQKHKIGFTKSDFKLKTKNIFHKAITSLFEGKIVKMIRTRLRNSVLDLENASKNLLKKVSTKNTKRI